MTKLELTDRVFGKLTVLGIAGAVGGKTTWLCNCSCGNTCVAIGTLLVSGSKISCGCASKKHFVDLTGKTFNKLTASEYLGKNTAKNNIYKWSCLCGKEIVAEGSDVKTGKISSCGCSKYEKQVNLMKEDPERGPIYSIYCDYKIKAKKRKYTFNINPFIFRILVKSNCYYCGEKPMNIRKVGRAGARTVVINGLDRVDNSIGYEESNVVPCCTICNQAKHTMPKNVFLQWVDKVYKFQKKVGDL